MQAELIDTGNLARSIEAVLFVASEALSIKTLAKLTGAEEADVSLALARIDADYAERGIVLREIAGGYRFASAPAARGVVEAYLMPPKTNLSPAALETLAIVAYLQPVTKGDIEGIRGVSADSVLSTLVDRRFLVEAGRKEVAGRPILYRTTPEFLEAFGLRSLEELPPVDIDAAAPVELALPIPTQAVPAGEEPNTQGNPAPDPATGTEPEPEPAEASAAVDESENVLVP
jgi:segregation and condensation protein B